MKADRWQQINRIVQAALELDANSLQEYLDKTCRDDAELRAEVASLMAMREEAEDFLEVKAIDIIAPVLIKDENFLAAADKNHSPASEQKDPLIGRKLGDFIIDEKMGAGGFGAIYRASQPILNREAVIKIINEDGSQHPHYRDMFTREAQLASRLEHPYTASIYAFRIEPDGLLWIAMEYVRGEPLNKFLKTQGPMSLEQFVPFFNKICEVVQTAHEAGIIHRDLKPANIMVIARAGRLLPKLLDFGIAKSLIASDRQLTSPDSVSSTNTSEGKLTAQDWQVANTLTNNLNASDARHTSQATPPSQTPPSNWTIGVGGSPPYMAPEQWQYNSTITARIDIYALGVLCYEVLTGSKPFQGDFEALRRAHLNSAIPSLGAAFSPEIAAAIDKVIAHAMAKRPEDRFATALEFAVALQAAAGLRDDQVESISIDNPFLGLSAFEPKDAAIFFGREKETENFLNRLRVHPLMVVVGPSGAGKSSFIQAGVAPRLENCRAIIVRPSAAPLSTLSARLIKEGLVATNLNAELAADTMELNRRLRIAAANANQQIVLIIDQLEEIFTLCSDQKERELYAANLAYAANSAQDSVRVICTLRDDFLMRARSLPVLGERLAQGLELLTLPNLDNLVRILVEPARRAGYQFEDKQIPVEMATSVTDRPMALPLLAFAAAKLWELRDRQTRQIRRKTYQELGGVGGALARHAEELLNQMLPSERKYVREAFRQLVTNAGTRAVLARSELQQLLGNNCEAQAVLEKLIAARLLSTYESEDGIESIEVAHEALLTSWPRLVKWQQEDVEGMRLRDQLREAARQWQERGEPKGLLWRDEALTELKLWQSRYASKLTKREQAFAQMSFAEAARSQRRRRLLYGAAVAILMIALTAAFWINREIQNQLLDSYLDQGRQELLNGRQMQAAVYFSEVYHRGVDTPALRLLLGQAMKSVDVAQLASFQGHTGGINQARFSPDGKRVLTASDDYTAKVWEVASSRLLFSLNGHTDEVLCASYSHDGKLIGTAGRDFTAKIWDAETGRLISTFSGHNAPLHSIYFSPDDKHILTSSYDKSVKIWDVESGNLILTIETFESISSAIFSPDGKRIITASADRSAKLWDAETGRLLFSIEGHTGPLRDAVFSPDGKKIATASSDQTAKIWDAANGKLLASLEGHKGQVTAIEFSADGKLIVTAGSDKTIKLWDGQNYRMLASLELHASYIWSVNFNKNATQVVTASYDRTAKVWDISKFRVMDNELISYPKGASAGEYSKDGRLILTAGGGNQVSLLDAQSRKLLRVIKISDLLFRYIIARFSPDSNRIATSGFYHQDTVTTNSAGMSLDRTVKIWDVGTGALLLTLIGHQADIMNIAFSHDGLRIVTASLDNTAKVWDANTGALQFTLVGHSDGISSAEFSPDDRQIITTSFDHSAKLWDAANGRLLRTFSVHSMPLYCAAFSPDGARIVTGSADATAKVTDAATGQLLCSLNGHTSDVKYCAFSRDGSLIATASGDGSAKIWDAANGKMIISLEGHSDWVYTVNFTPDQNHLITSSNDGSVRIWELPQESRTANQIAKLIEQYVPYRFERGQLIPVLIKPNSK